MISEITMNGLPGLAGKNIGAVYSGDLKSARNMIAKGHKYRIVTTAGEYGSVNVWRADDGRWYGERDVHKVTVEERSFLNDREKAARWFMETAKKCRGGGE